MESKVDNIELIIIYDIDGNEKIELKQNTYKDSGLTFSILDKEIDKHTNLTSIMFNNTNELREILNDFDTKYNLLMKFK